MAKTVIIGTGSKVVHILVDRPGYQITECGKGERRGFTQVDAEATCKVCIKKAAAKEAYHV